MSLFDESAGNSLESLSTEEYARVFQGGIWHLANWLFISWSTDGNDPSHGQILNLVKLIWRVNRCLRRDKKSESIKNYEIKFAYFWSNLFRASIWVKNRGDWSTETCITECWSKHEPSGFMWFLEKAIWRVKSLLSKFHKKIFHKFFPNISCTSSKQVWKRNLL